jgi:hypothetical protein
MPAPLKKSSKKPVIAPTRQSIVKQAVKGHVIGHDYNMVKSYRDSRRVGNGRIRSAINAVKARVGSETFGPGVYAGYQARKANKILKRKK